MYGSVRTVFLSVIQPYHPRPVISHPSSLIKPSDCTSALASKSEIHTAMTFSVSVPAILIRYSITPSILPACSISSPAFVSIMISLMSGLTESCSTLLVYCSRNPVSWFAAALDSCVSSVSLDVMISHPVMQIATTAMSRSTSITLPPI